MTYLLKLATDDDNGRSIWVLTVADQDGGKSTIERVRLAHSLIKDRITIVTTGERFEYVYVPNWLWRKIEPSYLAEGKVLRQLSTKQGRELATEIRPWSRPAEVEVLSAPVEHVHTEACSHAS